MISVFEIIQADAQQKPLESKSAGLDHGHEGGSFGTVLDGCSNAKGQQGATNDATSDAAAAGAKPAQGRVEPNEHAAKQIETNGNLPQGKNASKGSTQGDAPSGAVSAKDAGVLKAAGKKLQARFPGGFAVLTGGKVYRYASLDGEKVKDSAKNQGEAIASAQNCSEAVPVAHRDAATAHKGAKASEKGGVDTPVPVLTAVPPAPCITAAIDSAKADKTAVVNNDGAKADKTTPVAINGPEPVANDGANADNATPVAKDAGAQGKDSEAAIDVLRSGGSTDAARAAAGARTVQEQADAVEAVKDTGNDDDADDAKVQGEVPSTDVLAKDGVKKTPGFLDNPSHDDSKAAAALLKDGIETGAVPARSQQQRDSAPQQGAGGANGAGMSSANAKDAASKTTHAGFSVLSAPQAEPGGTNIVIHTDGAVQQTPVAAAPGMNSASDGVPGRKDSEGEHKGADQGAVPVKGMDNTAAAPGIKTQFVQDTAEAASAQRTAHASALYDKVTDGVRMCVSAAGKEISLQLSPEHLGNLHIRITGGEDGSSVSAKITVENASLKTILDSDAGRLKEIFGSQGLTLDRYTVDISRNGASSGSFGGASSGGFAGNERYLGQGGANGHAPAQLSETEHKPLYTQAAPYGAMTAKGVDLFA